MKSLLLHFDIVGTCKVLVFRAHHLNISNVFPAFTVLIKRSQWFFEGGDLSLHLREYFAPVGSGSTIDGELSQGRRQLSILTSKFAFFPLPFRYCSAEQIFESVHEFVKSLHGLILLLDISFLLDFNFIGYYIV